MNSEQLGELRLALSYASHDSLFSSSDNGVGCSMCQRNRSASLPVSTGVSLIGLAIMLYFYEFLRAKISKISETTKEITNKRNNDYNFKMKQTMKRQPSNEHRYDTLITDRKADKAGGLYLALAGTLVRPDDDVDDSREYTLVPLPE